MILRLATREELDRFQDIFKQFMEQAESMLGEKSDEYKPLLEFIYVRELQIRRDCYDHFLRVGRQ